MNKTLLTPTMNPPSLFELRRAGTHPLRQVAADVSPSTWLRTGPRTSISRGRARLRRALILSAPDVASASAGPPAATRAGANQRRLTSAATLQGRALPFLVLLF